MTSTNATRPDTRIDALLQQIDALKKELSLARRARTPEPVENWALRDLDDRRVHLLELFGDKRDLLVVHNMGRRCNYCTLWADGFNGFVRHLEARGAFVLCSADPPATAREHAASRGWTSRVVSGAGSDFARSMGYLDDTGRALPGVSAFRRLDDDRIVRTGHAAFGPGDDFCAVWPLFDLFEGGVGKWEPR